MKLYHKIQSIYKRHTEGPNQGDFIDGQWTLPEFEYLQNNIWTFDEKVDGTNIRVGWNDGGPLKFGGRTDKAQMPPHLLEALENLFDEETLKNLFSEADNVCLYGEGYGHKIQKGGGNYRSDKTASFVLFDVNVEGWFLKREDVEAIADKLNIEVTPIIGEGTIHDAIAMCKEGFNSRWGDFEAEGLILRPKVELKARNSSRLITKIKCKDFK